MHTGVGVAFTLLFYLGLLFITELNMVLIDFGLAMVDVVFYSIMRGLDLAGDYSRLGVGGLIGERALLHAASFNLAAYYIWLIIGTATFLGGGGFAFPSLFSRI